MNAFKQLKQASCTYKKYKELPHHEQDPYFGGPTDWKEIVLHPSHLN